MRLWETQIGDIPTTNSTVTKNLRNLEDPSRSCIKTPSVDQNSQALVFWEGRTRTWGFVFDTWALEILKKAILFRSLYNHCHADDICDLFYAVSPQVENQSKNDKRHYCHIFCDWQSWKFGLFISEVTQYFSQFYRRSSTIGHKWAENLITTVQVVGPKFIPISFVYPF